MSPNFKTFGLSCKSKTLTQVYNHKQKQLKNTKNGLKEITRTSTLLVLIQILLNICGGKPPEEDTQEI